MVKRYQGDDGDLKLLIGALSETSADVDVEAYAEQVAAFFEEAERPTLPRPYRRPAGSCRWSSCCATWRRTAS